MKPPAPPYTPGQRHEVTLAPGIEMAFRYIPPGEFRMGSRFETDWAQKTEKPVHRVRIPHGFWLGETPVTQEQFALWTTAVGEEHENEFKGKPNHPAEKMEWRQAVRYCGWLTERLRAERAFPASVNLGCLPTEAEWEYACRAGSETEYYNGDGSGALAEVGWYEGNSGKTTHAVDERAEAHPWGLRGMHGNVWEWCHDVWDEAAYRGRVEGDEDTGVALRLADCASVRRERAMLEDRRSRVFRGGTWNNRPAFCRSAARFGRHPGLHAGYLGFRVCLTRSPTLALRATAGRPAAIFRRRDCRVGREPASRGRMGECRERAG